MAKNNTNLRRKMISGKVSRKLLTQCRVGERTLLTIGRDCQRGRVRNYEHATITSRATNTRRRQVSTNKGWGDFIVGYIFPQGARKGAHLNYWRLATTIQRRRERFGRSTHIFLLDEDMLIDSFVIESVVDVKEYLPPPASRIARSLGGRS